MVKYSFLSPLSTPQDGRTCLIVAVIRGHLQTVTWLLLNGADVTYMTKVRVDGDGISWWPGLLWTGVFP